MAEPTAKRCKLERTIAYKIKAILPNEYTDEPQLREVFVSRIKNKKQISRIIRELNVSLPLPDDLKHLKRVRNDDIIICYDKPNLIGYLYEQKVCPTVIGLLSEQLWSTEVPIGMCKLRWQFEHMQKYWPVKFHPDKYYESLYDGSIFTQAEQDFHTKVLHFLEELSMEVENQQPCGACVDPRTNTMVAMAASRTETNPLYHCAMVLIDFVARTQSPSSINENIHDKFVEMATTNGAEVTLAGILVKHLDFLKNNEEFKQLKVGAEPIRKVEKIKTEDLQQNCTNNLEKYGPYLCTGYDIYLTQEPCLMCAMALVHSRVRRIFVLNKSETNGALITRFQLQGVKELNHHYEVFHCT